MSRAKEVTGMRFESLVVLGRSVRRSSAGALWVCQCDCGGQTVTTSLKLRTGHSSSCGCKREKMLAAGINRTHGLSKTRTYRTWKEMHNRCKNKHATQYKWYGAKGVTVCERWHKFENFFADMGQRPVNKTLDRIDSDGPYSFENCRWATAKQQAETNRGCFKKGLIPWNKRVTS